MKSNSEKIEQIRRIKNEIEEKLKHRIVFKSIRNNYLISVDDRGKE